MPVIECSVSETRAIDCELWAIYMTELAIKDRSQGQPQERVALAWSAFSGAGEIRLRSTLSCIAASRSWKGRPARLPEVYWWMRDPGPRRGTLKARSRMLEERDRLLILWGDDVWEELEDGVLALAPYEPLPLLVNDAPPSLKAERLEQLGDGGDRIRGVVDDLDTL